MMSSCPARTALTLAGENSGILDRIVGLEVGADDYISKRFHLRELLAQVKSVLRRRGGLLRRRLPWERLSASRVDCWMLRVANWSPLRAKMSRLPPASSTFWLA